MMETTVIQQPCAHKCCNPTPWHTRSIVHKMLCFFGIHAWEDKESPPYCHYQYCVICEKFRDIGGLP